MPIARKDNELYVALRLVDAKAFNAKELQAPVVVPWFHVPTLTAIYDGAPQTPDQVWTMCGANFHAAWSGLDKAKVWLDPETREGWSSYANKGADYSCHVVRAVLDLGEVEYLPGIVHKAGQSLTYNRQPVVWVKAADIIRLSAPTSGRDANIDGSPYIVSGRRDVLIETSTEANSSTQRQTIQDLRLQATVAEIPEKLLGYTPYTPRQIYIPRPVYPAFSR